ncbi:hypothetical protein ACHQM5_016833 [Ranunculus cassubicifolius]
MDRFRAECKKEFFTMPMTEEEMRLREELGMEIEKGLEREIMQGILILVHRLRDLKEKQADQGHKGFDISSTQQLEVLLGDVMRLNLYQRGNICHESMVTWESDEEAISVFSDTDSSENITNERN